jgi:hypothetical protein
MQRQTFTTDCPKSLIGRVIGRGRQRWLSVVSMALAEASLARLAAGKNGETVKALQFYTGTSIQVRQLEAA